MLSLVVLSYISVSHGRVNTSQVVHKGTGHLTRCLKPLDGSISHAVIPSDGVSAASHLFALIVESELRAASASAFSDDNEADYLQASIAAMDERLSSYALIARAAINVAVPLLTSLFSEKFARLQQGRGFTDPTQTLEELYSLLLITGHVLADEGRGETPLVPDAIHSQFMDVMEMDKHPVVIICGDTSQMTIIAFDDIIRGRYIKAQALVLSRTRFEHTIEQFHVWKFAWGLALMSTREFQVMRIDRGSQTLQSFIASHGPPNLDKIGHLCWAYSHLTPLGLWAIFGPIVIA
ncbi:hypothetical protein FXO38_36188 [Capsicum annuum]|nr:hypothetical protein FXO38_36188 [Capsicum annuum]